MNMHVCTNDAQLLRLLQKEVAVEPVDAGAEPNNADILVDAAINDQHGLDLVARLAARGNRVTILLREPALALVLAARACGAADVLAWPLRPGQLRERLQREAPVELDWRSAANSAQAPHAFIGTSPSLLQCFQAAATAALTDEHVLLLGEPGVGKCLLAHIIHAHSRRAGRPFITVSCTAFSETQLATELFGRDAAFGSPVQPQLTRAAGGTLLLDDVQELPATQVRRLAHVLETGTFTPLGSFEPQPLQARVLATAQTLPQDLADYFPLRITVPPLRKHADDIPQLAAYFLEQLSGEKKRIGLSAEALTTLQNYEWPGNVRQLKRALESAAAHATDGVIQRHHLPPEVLGKIEEVRPIEGQDLLLATVERRHIREVWRQTGGHISETAELLGIHRNTLRRKLEEYGLIEEETPAR